jgi:hypothetical protein
MKKKKLTETSCVVLPPNQPGIPQDIQRAEKVSPPVQEFKTLPEQVAKSTIVIKNWYVPELREKFNSFDRMKRIDLVFPFAKLDRCGEKQQQLLVDLPRNEYEVEQCVLKAKVLKTLGYRYCWLQDDSTLFDALMQLGES